VSSEEDAVAFLSDTVLIIDSLPLTCATFFGVSSSLSELESVLLFLFGPITETFLEEFFWKYLNISSIVGHPLDRPG